MSEGEGQADPSWGKASFNCFLKIIDFPCVKAGRGERGGGTPWETVVALNLEKANPSTARYDAKEPSPPRWAPTDTRVLPGATHHERVPCTHGRGSLGAPSLQHCRAVPRQDPTRSASLGVQHWLQSNVKISIDKIKRANAGCQLPGFLTLSQKHHWKEEMGITDGKEKKKATCFPISLFSIPRFPRFGVRMQYEKSLFPCQIWLSPFIHHSMARDREFEPHRQKNSSKPTSLLVSHPPREPDMPLCSFFRRCLTRSLTSLSSQFILHRPMTLALL